MIYRYLTFYNHTINKYEDLIEHLTCSMCNALYNRMFRYSVILHEDGSSEMIATSITECGSSNLNTCIFLEDGICVGTFQFDVNWVCSDYATPSKIYDIEEYVEKYGIREGNKRLTNVLNILNLKITVLIANMDSPWEFNYKEK